MMSIDDQYQWHLKAYGLFVWEGIWMKMSSTDALVTTMAFVHDSDN